MQQHTYRKCHCQILKYFECITGKPTMDMVVAHHLALEGKVEQIDDTESKGTHQEKEKERKGAGCDAAGYGKTVVERIFNTSEAMKAMGTPRWHWSATNLAPLPIQSGPDSITRSHFPRVKYGQHDVTEGTNEKGDNEHDQNLVRKASHHCCSHPCPPLHPLPPIFPSLQNEEARHDHPHRTVHNPNDPVPVNPLLHSQHLHPDGLAGAAEDKA